MTRAPVLLTTALIVLASASLRAANEPDEAMPGTAARRSSFSSLHVKTSFLSRAPSGQTFDLPDLPDHDPSALGAVLRMYDAGGGGGLDNFILPPGLRWRGLGSPPGSAGWRYRGPSPDPCRSVAITPHVVRAQCIRDVTILSPFSGDMQVVLSVGDDVKRYCATFGGTTRRNDATALFRTAAPPAACPTAPACGTLVRQQGSAGSGNGQFFTPSGVTVDPSGNVFVADTQNIRVQKFDADGNFLTRWGSVGGGPGQFEFVVDVAAAPDGTVYTADGNFFSHAVQRFDNGGGFLTRWGASGTADGEFATPTGIGVDGAGNVYVADQNNHRVQKFDANGGFLAKWGTLGTGDGQFTGRLRVAVDGGNVYVTDDAQTRVQRFDTNGNFLGSWGAAGIGQGLFEFPAGVAAAGGTVYVLDLEGTVQRFDATGTFLARWGASWGPFVGLTPNGITANAAGDVYTVDGQERLFKFVCP